MQPLEGNTNFQLAREDMKNTGDQIRTRPNSDCYVCGFKGEPLYQRLRDRHIFSVPGEWDLKRSPDPECGLVWLDPMPIEKDIGKAYLTYFTHGSNEQENVVCGKPRGDLRELLQYLKHGFLASRYNYNDGLGTIQRILGYGLYAYPLLADALCRGVCYVKYVPQGRLLDVGCGDGSYIQNMQRLGWFHTFCYGYYCRYLHGMKSLAKDLLIR